MSLVTASEKVSLARKASLSAKIQAVTFLKEFHVIWIVCMNYLHLLQLNKVVPVCERQDRGCVIRLHVLLIQRGLTETKLWQSVRKNIAQVL